MSEKKIIEALRACTECERCEEVSIEDIIRLINLQKNEIERLTDNNEHLAVFLAEAKSEAIKEFADRLKEELKDCARIDLIETTYYAVGRHLIDDLVKEMTEKGGSE